jgi:hypothetical protein
MVAVGVLLARSLARRPHHRAGPQLLSGLGVESPKTAPDGVVHRHYNYDLTTVSCRNNHGVLLTELASGTTYYFMAESTGANGVTGSSTVYSFTTGN